jgi:hypothetical protein
MALMTAYQKYLWLHRKNGIRIPAGRKIEMGFYSYFIVVAFIRLLVNLCFNYTSVNNHSADIVNSILEFNIYHFLLIMFIINFFFRILSDKNTNLNIKRFCVLPLSPAKFFIYEISGSMFNPVVWIIFIFFIPVLVFIVLISGSVFTVLSFILSSVFIYFLSWFLSILFIRSRLISIVSWIVKPLLSFLLIIMFISNFDFIIREKTLSVLVYTLPVKLTGFNGLLPGKMSPVTGIMYLPDTAGRVIFLSVMFTAVFLQIIACFTAFKRINMKFNIIKPGTGKYYREISGGPGWIIFRKELKYIINRPGFISGFVISIIFAVYIFLDNSSFRILPFTALFFLLAVNFRFQSNIFGHEGAAVIRYYFASYDSGRLFLEKNAVFAAVFFVHSFPVITASFLHYKWIFGAAFFFTAVLMVLLLLLYGNVSSVFLPYNIDSNQGGYIINNLFFCSVWLLPHFISKHTDGYTAPAYFIISAVIIVLLLTFYFIMLKRIKKYFKYKNILHSL